MISKWLNKRKLSRIKEELEKHSLSEVCKFLELFPHNDLPPFIYPLFDKRDMFRIGVQSVDTFWINWEKFQSLKLFL